MNEQTIFTAAIERAPAERVAFLDEACAGDRALRARVEKLLALHEHASFLARPAAESPATLDQPLLERPGTQIGPYKLMEQIGEGGMGLVFVAEQHEPVRRKVALKLIKPGMDSREIIARFEVERQALALMDHPNIARVLDAGATASGRPYFVMELVKGVPITQYCDDNRLPPRERLAMFADVCHAVQHAHQKGIIHRDIKPNNVLVSSHDGRPVVKVIDFGVAKAVGQQLTEKTIYTNLAQMVGTPLYMSPEQAGMSGLDIDTRTDIYSLGVLLYELLTGTTPFDKERLKQAVYDEMRRIIREEEPQKPSTRISATDAAPSIAAQRNTDPARLSKLVRGDLDWIVMKALEKDRNRRYETASGFALDVQRYLADEPVQACPPSAGYRFKKFARRNKARLTISALLLLVVALAVGGAGWVFNDRIHREARTAEHVHQALSESENLYRQGKFPDALVSAQKAQAMLDHGGGSKAVWRRVRGRVADLEMAARLENSRLAGTVIGKDSRFVFETTARGYAAAFRGYGIDLETLEPVEAAERIRQQEIREQLTVALDHWISLSIVDPEVKQRLSAIVAMADSDAWRKRLRAAAGANVQSLKELANSPEVLGQPPSTLILLGTYLSTQGEAEAAIDLLRQAQRRYPGDFWLNLKLANFLWLATQHDDAIRFFTAAAAIRPESPAAIAQLGMVFDRKGMLGGGMIQNRCAAEAMANYQEALRRDPDYIDALVSYGLHLFTVKKDYKGAIGKFSRVIELDPKYHWGWGGRSMVYRAIGKHDSAIADLTQLLALHPLKWNNWRARADSYLALGQPNKAIADFTRAIDLKPDYAPAWSGRHDAYVALGQPEKAAADLEQLELLNKAAADKNQKADPDDR
jgi:serine/threonine protein kinase/Tfp pilus assembly protein PilF